MEDSEEALISQLARLYYFEDLPKTDIARRFGLSRFKVARLLEQGREAGIINIEIRGNNAFLEQTANDLAAHLGLARCIVVPGAGTEGQVRDRISRAAANHIRSLIRPGDSFGISWGRTVLSISKYLTDLPPSFVVQLTGTVGEDLTQSPLEILRSISLDTSVRPHPIFAPLFVASAESAATLKADPAIAAALARFDHLKLAAVSVGSWDPPITQLRDFLSASEIALLDAVPAQAEMLGIFIDGAGRIVSTDLDGRRIAAAPADLLRTPHVLAAAGGLAKVPALMAVARSGLITILVTDDQAAQELLRLPPVREKANTRGADAR